MHELLKYPTVHEALLYEKLDDDKVRVAYEDGHIMSDPETVPGAV